MAASFWPHIKAILMSDPRHCSRKCATFWMSWMSWMSSNIITMLEFQPVLLGMYPYPSLLGRFYCRQGFFVAGAGGPAFVLCVWQA